jgi:hypothetical protein
MYYAILHFRFKFIGVFKIRKHYPEEKWNLYSRITRFAPPLWSSGRSSWLQIQRSGFDSRSCQIFWGVIGLEQGPLSLVSTNEELLGRKSSGSGLESREYDRRDPSRWPHGILYPQKLVLSSSTSGGRSVGIVRSWTQAMEFSFSFLSIGLWTLSIVRNSK